MDSARTRFEKSYQTAKAILNDKRDVDIIIARYMFEKFGTLPEVVTEMDDYQKGVVFAILEDIVNVHKDMQRRSEEQMRRSRNVRRKR